jgi:hypothetical protein
MIVVNGQDAKMAKMIGESRWNAAAKYDESHQENALGRHCQDLSEEEQRVFSGLRRLSGDWFNHTLHQPIARDEMSANALNHDCGDHSEYDHPAHQTISRRTETFSGRR